MKKKGVTAIIIVAILVVSAGLYFMYTTTAWETDNEFGAWSQQISIVYTDGTTQPLNILWNHLDVYSNGKQVSGIRYILNAKATGDSSTVNIILSSYEVKFQIGTYAPYVYQFTTTASIPIDDAFHQIALNDFDIDTLVPSLPDGSYTLVITPQGNIAFNFDGGPNVLATLPEAVNVGFSVNNPTGQLEDFSIYNESDAGNYMSLSNNNTIQITNMPRSSTSYFQKAKTLGTSFHLKLKVTISELQPNNPDYLGGFFGIVAFTRNIASTNNEIMRYGGSGIDDGVVLYTYTWTNLTGVPQPAIYLRDNTRTGVEHTVYDGWIFNLPGTFYIDVYRTNNGANFYADIYSNEYTTLIKQLHINGCSIEPFNYFLPAFASGGGGAPTLTATGTVSNFIFS